MNEKEDPSENSFHEIKSFNAAFELQATLYTPAQTDPMDDIRARARWRDAGFWNHFGHGERDEARIQEDKDTKGAGQETKTSVCKDDEFVYRGANPRTGIVSPFIFGEGSGNDWQGLETPAEKTGHSLVEDDLKWGQVANVPLIPITQSFDREPSCTKSSKFLHHNKTFGHLNSKSTPMRDEKIKEYQDNLAAVCQSKTQNAAGMIKIASPTPSPTEPQRIRRKKVGSGQVQKVGSIYSETCENLRQASSKKVSMNDIGAFETSIVSSIEAGTAPFTALADHPNGNIENPAVVRDTVTASAASKSKPAVSSKYIASLHFLQPTHRASMTTSYRRSAQLLATQPGSTNPRDKRRNIGTASTADTSYKPGKSEQRPQAYRKFGTTSIPTVDFDEPELEDEGQYFLSIAPQRNASIIKQSMGVGRIDPNLQNHLNYQGCAMPSFGREFAKVPAIRPVSKAKPIN